MKKLLKFLFALIAITAGLVVVLVVAVKVIDDEQHRKWLVGAVESATGRTFTVEHLALDFGATIRAHARGVSLGNAEWSDQGNMLTAREITAEIHLPAIVGGVADVRATVDGLRARVESGPEGRSNWQFGEADPTVMEEDEEAIIALRPLIREILFTDSVVEWSRDSGAQVNTIQLDRLALSTPEADTLLVLSGKVDSWPLALEGNLGPLVEVLDRRTAPLTLSGSLAEIALTVGGQWGPLTPAADLALNAELAAPSTAAVAAMAGVTIGEPGSLEASLDVTARNGGFSLDNIVLTVAGDLVAANASGAVADLNALQGMAVDVDVKTAALGALLGLFGVELPNPLPGNATVRGQIFGDQGRIGARDISATLADQAVSIKASGKVDDVVALEGLEITVEGVAPSLAGLSPYAGIALPALGELEMSGKVISGEDGPVLTDFVAELQSTDVALQVTGSMANLLVGDGMDGVVDLTIRQFSDDLRQELGTTLAQFDVVVPLERLPESLSLKGQLRGGLKSLSVKELQGSTEDSGLVVTVEGSVENIIGLTGVDIRFAANGPTEGALKRQVTYPLPSLGELALTGMLQSSDTGLALAETDLRLSGGLADLSVTGGMTDLMGLEGIDAKARLKVDGLTAVELGSLATLLQEFDVEAPLDRLPASFTIESGLQGGLQSLGLRDTQLIASDEGLELNVSGGAEDLISQKGIGADIQFTASSIATLSRFAGTELPDLGKLSLKGRVTGNEQLWGLDGIRGSLEGQGFKASLQGSVTDLVNARGINATMGATVDDLERLGVILEQDLPSTPPVMVSASLSEAGEQEPHVKVEINSGDARVHLEGDLSGLKSPDQVVVALEVAAENLLDFQPFVPSELPDMGPLSLSGNFQARQPEGSYQLKDFVLSLDDQSARGDLLVKLANDEGRRTTVSGELTIPFLDLTPLMTPAGVADSNATGGESAAADQSTKASKKLVDPNERSADRQAVTSAGDSGKAEKGAEESKPVKRLFPDDPLLLDQMRLVDAEVNVTAERLQIGKTDIRQLNAELKLQDGMLALSPLTGVAGNGTIDGEVKLDSRQSDARLSADLVMTQVPMPITGGRVDLNIDLEGNGSTPAAIMGSLDGELLLQIRDGQIPQSFATRLGKGLFSFSGERDYTELECGILRMDITDGVANFDDRLAVQLTEVNWTGGGEVDFNTEEIAIAVAPKPRKGLGITVGELASLVYVGGTLAEPSVRLNPKDVAIKYGKYLAYVSTGGLSLVAEALFNRAVAGRDLCSVIAEEPEKPAENGEPATSVEVDEAEESRSQ